MHSVLFNVSVGGYLLRTQGEGYYARRGHSTTDVGGVTLILLFRYRNIQHFLKARRARLFQHTVA